MRLRLVQCYDDRAEGDCIGIPYNTDLVSSQGVSIHFWCKDEATAEKLPEALKVARYHRDIVGCTYSIGAPSSYWAHEDMNK